MFTKCFLLVLAALLIHVTNAAPVMAQATAEKEARFVQKVKENILELGIGPESRVRVKLRDKTKLEGYISQAGADSFTVTDVRTGTATTVAYTQVKQIKGSNYLSGVLIGSGPGKVSTIFLKGVPMALGFGLALFFVTDILRNRF